LVIHVSLTDVVQKRAFGPVGQRPVLFGSLFHGFPLLRPVRFSALLKRNVAARKFFSAGTVVEHQGVLEWICVVLLFSTSPQWSTAMKYAWVFIMYILVYSIFGTMLAAKQTPYLIRAFNGNSRLVTKVASYGGLVSMAGSIAISMTFPPKSIWAAL